MIGNYVYPDHNSSEHVMVCAQDFENTEYLEPIPLDESWFKKFGFNSQSRYYEFEYAKGFIIAGYLNNYWLVDLYNEDGYREQIKIEHVHALQNVYKSLTGNKLEIQG